MGKKVHETRISNNLGSKKSQKMQSENMWNLKNKTKYTMENTGEFLEWLRIPGKLTMLHDISKRERGLNAHEP